MHRFLGAAVVIASIGATVAPTSAAQEEGLAGMHSWRRVGGRTCFSDHSHDGSGTGSSRRQAEGAAIRNWISFTALEYGNAWAHYSMAVGKTMRCDSSGQSWWCSTEAYPCRGR